MAKEKISSNSVFERVFMVLFVIGILPIVLLSIDNIIIQYPLFAGLLGTLTIALFFFFIKVIIPNMENKK